MNTTATASGQARLKRATERGARRSGIRAFVFLVFALAAATITAALFTRYLEVRTAAARVPTVKVVVAGTDIPTATPLRVEALQVVDWPAATHPENAPSDPKQVTGRIAIVAISKGEPILEAKLASADAGSGLAALLPSGMRAVAVKVDDVVGVAGFVHPGDHVDVIVTMKPIEGANVPPVSKIILQDIRVLAVGKDLSDGGNREKPVSATVAALMVTSEQSEKLALAATKGSILLTLRSRIDSDDVETKGIVPPVMLAGVPTGEKPAPPPPAPRPARPAVKPVPAHTPAAEAPPEEKQVVEILRGDLYEKRAFKETKR